ASDGSPGENVAAIELVLDDVAAGQTQYSPGIAGFASGENHVESQFGAPEDDCREQAGKGIGQELCAVLVKGTVRNTKDVATVQQVLRDQPYRCADHDRQDQRLGTPVCQQGQFLARDVG